MGEPAAAAFDDPAARQDGEALLTWRARDSLATHVVQVGPEAAPLSGEGAAQDRRAQAGLCHLALIEGRKRVTLLDRRGHHGGGEPVPVGIHHGHPLALNQAFGGIEATRPAHGKAFHGLRVDDRQPGIALAAFRPAAQPGQSRIIRSNSPDPAQRRNQP